MKRMRHLGATVALGAVVMFAAFSSTGSALATTTGLGLRCFSGGPATCTYDRSAGTATLDVQAGGYAGVSVLTNLAGTPVGSLNFSFSYLCLASDPTTSCVAGGSPRWGFSIDTTGDGKRDGYAFIDAANCGLIGISSGTVNNNCTVYYKGVEYYANWDAFAAAHQTATITRNKPFIVADYVFYGRISNVTITVA